MPATTIDLLDIRRRTEAFYKKWIASGGKTVAWKCTHCKSKQITRRPDKEIIGEKGYTDSATTCLDCGELSFVLVWPSGRVEVRKMPKLER